MKKENIPSVSERAQDIVLTNDYWEVIHNKNKGGAISSIRFFNGTNKNFLCQPLYAHIARGEDHAVVFYKQSLSRDTRLKIRKKNSCVEIKISGHFAEEKGKTLPVRFEQIYTYYAWGLVKVVQEFIIEKKIENVYEFSPCNFYITPDVNTLGIRRASYSRAYPVSDFCEWREIGFSRSYRDSRNPVPENHIPIYFCAINKGVEGIEFYRGSNSDWWDAPFNTEGSQSLFTHERDLFNRHFYIRCEIFCDWFKPHTFSSARQKVEYYLGLPFISRPEDVGNSFFHCGVDSTWPADTDVKNMAEHNVRLLRHHDDSTWKPKGWPDGLYPPYAPADMKELDRVINTAHRYGMKIVPYFSLKEFHPRCPAFKKNADKWKRWVDNKGTISGVNGPFGGYMCMKSGWLKYRKESIGLVLKRHKFDGVYYDHMWFRTCRHPKHCSGHPHTDVDEVLGFYFWTRKMLGEKGFIFVHLSGCPSMVAENIADLAFVSEDFFQCRPLPGRFDPLCEFVPIIPRHTVNGYAHNSTDKSVAKIQHLACFLEGWPTYNYLEEFAKFKDYDLSTYKFIPTREKPVLTNSQEVYASLYYSKDSIFVYCANLGFNKKKVCLRLNPLLRSKFKGWKVDCKITINGLSSQIIDCTFNKWKE